MGFLITYSEQDLSPTVTEILHVFIVFDAITNGKFVHLLQCLGWTLSSHVPSIKAALSWEEQ